MAIFKKDVNLGYKKFNFMFVDFFKKERSYFYSIQELNELRQRERKIMLARRSRKYILEINKKQRLWLEKYGLNSRKAF